MKLNEVREILNENFNTFSHREGIFTVKRSYYYGISQSGEKHADIVKNLIPNAEIVDYGNHYHGFVGGSKSGSPQDSYYYVKFKVGN